MKNFKKSYKENLDKLKRVKRDIADHQSNTDAQKQQLVVAFEEWYEQNFDIDIETIESVRKLLKKLANQKSSFSYKTGLPT